KMDGYVLSRNSRICFGVELTCPMEANNKKWHQSKLAKYENEISSEAKKNGWRFYSIIIEVGARGWVPTSTLSALTRLGLPAAKSLANRLSFIALKSSYIIWLTVSIKTSDRGGYLSAPRLKNVSKTQSADGL